MDEGFAKLIGWLLGFFLLLWLIMYAIAIGAFVACLCSGIISFFIVKTKKALVREQSPGAAVLMSLGWSAVLSVGFILGSFGLVVSLGWALGDAFAAQFASTYQYGLAFGTFWGLWAYLDRWVLGSAYVFFVKTGVVLYLANRVFLARRRSGSSWLGVIPPLCAMVVFFVADHWNAVLSVVVNPTAANFTLLLQAFWAVIYLPIDLVVKAVTAPEAVLTWARDRIVSSDGSLFKLAELFPTIFWLVGLALAGKALAGLASPEQTVAS